MNPTSDSTLSARHLRLWLLERLGAPSGAAVVVSGAAAPRGVDPVALKETVAAAVLRHPMFRARFEGEAEPTLVLADEAPRVEVVQAGSGSARERARVWLGALEPFEMKRGRLLRAAVVAGPDEIVIVVAAHRAVADARTLDRLVSEIAAGVGGKSAIKPGAPLGNLSPVGEGARDAALARARACLSGIDEPAELSGDRPRPVVQTQRVRTTVLELDAEAAGAASRGASALGVGEESFYLAAFVALVGRYTRKRYVVLGRRVAGRSPDTFGPLDTDVLVRARLDGPVTVAALVRAVQAELEAADAASAVPFEALLDGLAPPRDASRAPVFQIGFVFDKKPELSQGWSPIDLDRPGSALDLTLEIHRRQRPGGPDALSLVIVESADLFTDPGRAARLAGHLGVLLRGFAQDSGAIVSGLPIVTEAEREALVRACNPWSSFPSEDTLASRIERAARARPEAVAISSGADRLTYAELESRAGRLARRLRAEGVGRDDRVGVCMERTPGLIVALYAILKAGGAYVPVEPTQPKDRMGFVLADAEPKVVLTDGDHLSGIESLAAPVLRVDTLEAELAGAPADPLPPPAVPAGQSAADALAYIIYTSGSTGRPKGCLIDHRHVVRLLDATQEWFRFDEDDVWTMFHSVAFDFSVWEIWGALCYGGRVVVVPYWTTRSPDDFRKLVAEEGVTVLNQTPSAFRQFIEADARAAPPRLALRTVIFGGEALDLESLRPWFDRHGDQRPRLVNMYGITETTVHVTYRPLSRADLDAGFTSVIGVPIPDLRNYVVDESLELAPVGVPGELLVGGAGVSRGYWRRPELTPERFLVDRFSGLPGERIYRSGDLVRRLPSGELDYLGRIDQQVKIRGFRIETGEVEAALRKSGLARDVAVLTAKKQSSETVLVAYVVTDATAADLRAAARAALPEYMVPAVFVRVPAIPMTGNGKVDRRALPDPWAADQATGADEAEIVPPKGRFEEAVAAAFAEVLRRPRVGATCHFFEEGGSSLDAVTAAARIGALLGVKMPVIKLFEHTTVEALAAYLKEEHERAGAAQGAAAGGSARVSADDEPIAIIAMVGRFPGANTVDALWRNLLDARETVTFFDASALDPSLDPAMVASASYVRARGVLDDVAGFDAGYFAMSPREAEVTDPQHRLALELACEALETAGYDPARYPGAIGVYAGEYNVTYYIEHVLRRPDVVERVGAFQAMVGNEKDFIATRIAHKLDLKGPALSIHTACSTSLVAIASAFFALRTRQCDMAIAGAAAVTCPPSSGYTYQEGSMLSPDGHTRPFDADARGTIFSDGAAFVVLKRLSDALRDHDTVIAVVRGAAINNDGAGKMSFTAPSAAGQASVVARALDVAGVDAATIGYIEAHGTATPLGDPIEIEGLRRVFEPRTDRRGFCGVGSIKSNFGHIVAASGAAGLIKAALAVQSGVIPATLHFRAANTKLGLEGSPFYVVDRTTAWPEGLSPRRAGVSSFGVGGTNAHLVIEQAPQEQEASAKGASRRTSQLLVVSARTEPALAEAARRLGASLGEAPAARIADAGFTLATGRRIFPTRRFAVARSGEDARKALSAAAAPIVARARPSFVFAFPGQGAQYVAMGRALAREEPVFRRALERCMAVLTSGLEGPGGPLDCDLRKVLDPGPAERADAEAMLVQTAFTQPAIFAIEYALAELWMSLGIHPDTLLGHSVGEFVAACLAGVLSLEDALRLVHHRGRLMQSAEPGVMLAVRSAASDVVAEVDAASGLAAVNAPKLCVVAGPEASIVAIEQRLAARGIATNRLRTSHAFHSPMMDGAVGPFLELVRGVKLSAPRIPIVSTVTGEPLTAEQATDPAYWARHLRETVRFSDALTEVWRQDPDRVVLEIGPRATLATLAKQIAADPKRNVAVASLDIGSAPPGAEPDEAAAFLRAAGQIWARGGAIDWAAFYEGETRRRVPLPTYPFERTRSWIDPPARAADLQKPAAATTASPPASRRIAALAIPSFLPSPPAISTPEPIMQAAPSRDTDRRPAILDAIRGVFEEASGVELADADPAASFMELGLDSLSLTQCAQLLAKRVGSDVTFRQLVEDLVSLETLVAHLDASLPESAYRPVVAEPVEAAAPAASGIVAAPAAAPAAIAMTPMFAAPATFGGGGALAGSPDAVRIVAQQLELMARQLDLLRGSVGAALPMTLPMAMSAPVGTNGAPVDAPAVHVAAPVAALAVVPVASPAAAPKAPASAPKTDADDAQPKKVFGAGARIERTGSALPREQETALRAFMQRYVARTHSSKEFTAENRPLLADPRVVTGFKPMWKEIVYPLVVDRSEGAHIWDIDGNRYVDVTCGFGANFLGHRPPYVVEAVKKQLDAGFEIGPQHPLVADCAKLLRDLTGHERVVFCCTGSEAVLGATRLARTVTGRPLVVTFTGDYHGILDEVILRGTRSLRSVPGAPGILPSAVQNNLVLDYGEDSALAIIEQRADEIAAVLVEPVQSRRPELQPRAFLQKLREITQKRGIALIFDEIITGFRLCPGGAQQHFGVQADLATYGKILGGGVPIGAIAGNHHFMDALDGGKWSYGDASVPEIGVTYFAGTFVRHPLGLAACKASLLHIKEQGPALQQRINTKTAALVDEINAFMKRAEAPYELTTCSSWFKLSYPDELPFGGLIFFWLRSKGVHIWDGRVAFLTTAHTDEDCAFVRDAFMASVREMQQAGFLPKPTRSDSFAVPPVAEARLGKDKDGSPAWFLPDPARPGKWLLHTPQAAAATELSGGDAALRASAPRTSDRGAS